MAFDFGLQYVSVEEIDRMNAISEFSEEYRFLSNFWFSKVVMYGIEFPTLEHAFQAAKIDPKDPRHTENPYAQMRKMAALKKPRDAKRAGGRNGWVLMRKDWDQVKLDLILVLLRRKFQDASLREKLLATGERPLIEGNHHGDDFWGMKIKDGFLTGRNLLGQMLMKVRAEIRAELAAA